MTTYQLPTHSSEIAFGSIQSGELHIELKPPKACAWVGDFRMSTFWPEGFSVRDNPLRLINAEGETVATNGDMVTVGGGNSMGGSPDCPGENDALAAIVSNIHPGAVP